MKEKRKKIFARVGAVIAVVALVAVLALPCFALVSNETLTSIEEYYTLTPTDPIYNLMHQSFFDANKFVNLIQFKLPEFGDYIYYKDLITIDVVPTEANAYCAVYKVSDNTMHVSNPGYWLVTNSSTGSSYRNSIYTFVDFATGVEFVKINVRFVYSNATVYSNTTVTGTGLIGSGGADDYVIGTVTTTEGAVSIESGISWGYLKTDKVNININTFDDGYKKAMGAGSYDEGYNAGYDDGLQQTSLIDFITALFRAPMEFVNDTLDFEIFGIQMATAVKVLITMAIIGVVVTIVWKAVK